MFFIFIAETTLKLLFIQKGTSDNLTYYKRTGIKNKPVTLFNQKQLAEVVQTDDMYRGVFDVIIADRKVYFSVRTEESCEIVSITTSGTDFKLLSKCSADVASNTMYLIRNINNKLEFLLHVTPQDD